MRHFQRLFLSFFVLLALVVTAQARPDWVMSEADQDPVPVSPKAVFNANEAKQLLGPGTSSITGVASFRFKSGLFGKKKPQQHPPVGSKIYRWLASWRSAKTVRP